MTAVPRDQYSEVVHPSRRWTPDWYQWLTQLTGDVNTLEGFVLPTSANVASYTPVLHFGGGATGITYDTQRGVTYRVGKLVFGAFHIKLTSKGSSTGGAAVTIPFQGNSFGAVDLGIALPTFYAGLNLPLAGYIYGYVGADFNDIVLRQYTSTAGTPVLADTDFTNSGELYMNFVYLSH